MQSVKSNALEPDDSELIGKSRAYAMARYIPVYGLPVIAVILAAVFSILLPNTFPTSMNVRLVLYDQSVIAILALGAMTPMVAGKIDISIGYGVVMWMVLSIGLQTNSHWSWPLAAVVTILLGGCLGVANGLLVELAQVDAFIATLGTGTVIYAIALAYTHGQQVVGKLSNGFLAVGNSSLLGIPIAAVYVVVIMAVMWAVFEFLPVGRRLYAVGANPEAAKLNGIPTRRYVIGSFVTSGMLTGLAGVVLASQLRIGQIGIGMGYLLPPLVAAFLGSATIRPGRVNVLGTIVAMIILSIGTSGLQQLVSGQASWVSPLFNGATLVLAIAIAGMAGRRRIRVREKAEREIIQQQSSASKRTDTRSAG